MAKASPKLEINQATVEELAALPGIGPSTAETLVKLRDQRGGFKSVDELEEVQGVGAQTLKNIRGHVSVSAKAETGAKEDTMAKASPKLEINQATVEELAALPGIGPSTAETLVKLRDQRGGFKSVDELEEVQGVGAQTLKNIRGHVSVSAKAETGAGGNGAEAAGRTAEKATGAARETGKTAAAVATETARAESEAFRKTAASSTEAARRTLEVAGGKSEEFRHAADEARQDVLGSVREVNEMWLGLVQTQIQANVEAAQRLMQCRTPKDLAEVQSEYVRSSMERMVDGTTRAVAAGSHLAQTMWRPFQTVTHR